MRPDATARRSTWSSRAASRCPRGEREAVVRIASEAVANAAQHSGAEMLRIYLERADAGMRLGVEDDGEGFDEDQPTARLRAGHDEGPRRSARREAARRLPPWSPAPRWSSSCELRGAHASSRPGRSGCCIADDHAPTREDVRRALTEGGLVVCAEAADAARAVQQALETRPDICLLDVRMPGGGVAAAWEIAARLPTTKVVMLTVSDEDGDLFRALRAGAVSYLVKDIDFAYSCRRRCATSPKERRRFRPRSSLAWSCSSIPTTRASARPRSGRNSGRG